MKKKIKMFLYAEPGTGKSTFASKAPNPFFITTDGNFEWLDLPEEQHKQVFSFKEAKALFNKWIVCVYIVVLSIGCVGQIFTLRM